MKAIKVLAYAVAGLLILCVVALGAAAFIVDGPFVKARLERFLKEEKHRSIAIEGDPKVRLFPVAGISLGKTVISEHASDKPFVSLDSL